MQAAFPARARSMTVSRRTAPADINEYNGGHYVVQKAHGRDDITAIPVFLHRRFRHGFIYINTGKGISAPLRSRRAARRLPHHRRRGQLLDARLSRREWRAAPLDHLGDRDARRGLGAGAQRSQARGRAQGQEGRGDAARPARSTPSSRPTSTRPAPRAIRASRGCGPITRRSRPTITGAPGSSRSCT